MVVTRSIPRTITKGHRNPINVVREIIIVVKSTLDELRRSEIPGRNEEKLGRGRTNTLLSGRGKENRTFRHFITRLTSSFLPINFREHRERER